MLPMKNKKKKADASLTPEQVIQKRRQRLYDKEDIKSFFSRLFLMVVIFVVLFGVIFGVTPMRDNDMMPRIGAGDLILYNRLDKQMNNQDVCVYEKDGQQYVGRVVAQGGDKVEITENDELKINDNLIWETDIFYPTPQYEDGIKFPVVLEENQYFVLCDYREGGKDSRYFGPVSSDELTGKVISVLRRSGL